MIKSQQARLRKTLEAQGIRDRRVLDVIQQTRRDLFVTEANRHRAYDDTALPITCGQTISQPYIVAVMTEALELRSDSKMLEIGTGCGYQTAVLSALCGKVVTVERIGELSEAAHDRLQELGYDNIDYHIGDGTLGVSTESPFDAIIVTAASPQMPPSLFRQLAFGGRMVIPVGNEAIQSLRLVHRTSSSHHQSKELCGCRFVKLIGAEGW
ncbi:MAG: protein-L-isoaspartate O-methyltransferase [Planctomycetaceae bacterium]|nr:protein-L-isoaspartate O-methyltransferase [Planctomycetaceae bacterium]